MNIIVLYIAIIVILSIAVKDVLAKGPYAQAYLFGHRIDFYSNLHIAPPASKPNDSPLYRENEGWLVSYEYAIVVFSANGQGMGTLSSQVSLFFVSIASVTLPNTRKYKNTHSTKQPVKQETMKVWKWTSTYLI